MLSFPFTSPLCMQSIKEHNLKANHNTLSPRDIGLFICMQSIKEHNLKANHNIGRMAKKFKRSVCNLSKNTI
jgi:sulfur relay (sulfurtransferase) DsrF/TusC family protein